MVTQQIDPADGWDLIYSYTRKQAIEDGVLVDLMQSDIADLVREAGFRLPIAMTSAAYAATVKPLDQELPAGQDVRGRLWDVLNVLRATICGCPAGADRLHFQVLVWNGLAHEEVRLWALCGPGDAAEPVLTLMLEGED